MKLRDYGTIKTERLLLRHFQPGDEAGCFAFLSDRDTCWKDGGYEPFTEQDEEYRILMGRFAADRNRYMIVLREENQVIGTLHLMEGEGQAVEIGYVISPGYRRWGYASEAVTAAIDTIFAHGDAEKITAGAFPYNPVSMQMLEKLGFVRTGRVVQESTHPGKATLDLVTYEYTNREE